MGGACKNIIYFHNLNFEDEVSQQKLITHIQQTRLSRRDSNSSDVDGNGAIRRSIDDVVR